MATDNQKIIQIFYNMMKSRLFEEKAVELKERGLIADELYLSFGQEATAASLTALSDDDIVFASHRAFHIALSCGCGIDKLFAELMGRPEGLAAGNSGGCFADNTVNFYGVSPLSAACFAKAAGGAMSLKIQNKENIAVCYAGEGAAFDGRFYETLNIACMKALPLVIFIENNTYAGKTPSEKVGYLTDIADIAKTYNIPGLLIDGNDALAVHSAMESARAFALSTGPVIIETKTCRLAGHTYEEDTSYRSEEELGAWVAYDAIENLKEYMLANHIGIIDDLVMLRTRIQEEIDSSAQKALAVYENNAGSNEEEKIPELAEILEDINE